jgi:hypothetical protein
MIHNNSFKAWSEEREALSEREGEIFEMLLKFQREGVGLGSAFLRFRENGLQGLTDRQIMLVLEYDEMNCVRPRITELKKKGLVREVGKTKCPRTGKSVRLVRAFEQFDTNPNQMRLL